GTILKDARKIEISLKNPSNSNWQALNEIQNLNVTRYDLTEDVQYLATKEGFLFESKNNESRLVLDLNNDAQFPFNNDSLETGFLGIASKNKLVYVSYSSKDINGDFSLVVDEYSMDFSKVRNIIKIDGFAETHFGGNLLFDNLGKLYLTVGDGSDSNIYEDNSQNLNDYRGKILRLDISDLKLDPEIVAYGIRNPWGVTIDSKDRMFILQCGEFKVEAVYLLNDLYSGNPANLGWPVFEGSIRMRKDPLMLKDVSAPIFETNKRPGCLTAGVYLDDIESFLFGDFFGTIRLLKQQENGEWYLLHEYKLENNNIWDFGLDTKTKKIFIAPNNLELEILVEQVKLNQ
ncbi:PQQ-dependent sugar dehydrogenase, partial [Candidatus Pseudothioglobus singularis]|nr:PQQ-dependent sugar dehydrogenase [Candidatus Pseudothioglobus singularis]